MAQLEARFFAKVYDHLNNDINVVMLSSRWYGVL